MKFCADWFYTIISAVALWIILTRSYGESASESEIFHKSHTAVITVITETNSRGTGFSIDPKEYVFSRTRNTVRLGITAFHVVKGARKVYVYLYKDEKDGDGNWKNEKCQAVIYNVNIVRDVAILAILCDTCNCKRLGALQTRISDVNEGETVLIIGDSAKRLLHSFADGKLSYTNTIDCLACESYSQIDATDKTFFTRVHGLTGSINRGDSGSAVLDTSGKVIGMTLAIRGDLKMCLTMTELLKAYEQALELPRSVDYVGCTAHESAFLARKYWGEGSGKSILEMNSLARATNAQYFALAHDEFGGAHAFTFRVLWWQVLPGNDYMIEDASQCLGDDSFTDGHLLEHTNGKVYRGCVDNACRRNPNYYKRDGEDNDRRWAIFKRKGEGKYVPSDISLAIMENIAGESDYWQKKAGKLSEEKEDIAFEHQWYISVVNTVSIFVVSAVLVVFYILYTRFKNAENMLKEANRERDRLVNRLFEIEALQNLEPEIAPVEE